MGSSRALGFALWASLTLTACQEGREGAPPAHPSSREAASGEATDDEDVAGEDEATDDGDEDEARAGSEWRGSGEATEGPTPAPEANVDLTIAPPTSACERALRAEGETARVGAGGTDAVACLRGADAPDAGPVVREAVDVLAEGADGCGRRERFTFRHDGVTVATRCTEAGGLAVRATGVHGTVGLVALQLSAAARARVAWAGDWNGDGRLEWVVTVRDGDALHYLGAFGLDDDDRIVRLARWRR